VSNLLLLFPAAEKVTNLPATARPMLRQAGKAAAAEKKLKINLDLSRRK